MLITNCTFSRIGLRNEDFIHQLILINEAHFYLNGFVSKLNCRIWGSENSKITHERALHFSNAQSGAV